jgi:hypothetical protein
VPFGTFELSLTTVVKPVEAVALWRQNWGASVDTIAPTTSLPMNHISPLTKIYCQIINAVETLAKIIVQPQAVQKAWPGVAGYQAQGYALGLIVV